MHLKTGAVAIIIAAAAGAAAGRATAPHVSNAAAAGAALGAPPGMTAGSGAALGGDASPVPAAGRALGVRRARVRVASGDGSASVDGTETRAVVYVAGAVTKPGVYALRAGERADDALRAAGGATAQADLVAIDLAARVEDGEEIAIPVKGAEATVTDAADSQADSQTKKRVRRHAGKRAHRRKRRRQSEDDAGTSDPPSTADAPSEPIDVNAADEATLETLPGVGPSLAERIVTFRDLNGPFASTDELLDVGGMTAGKVDAIAPYVTFR